MLIDLKIPGNIKTILKTTYAYGVSIHLVDDDNYEIQAVCLNQTKDNIEITGKWDNLNSLDELSEVITSKYPIWLSVSGRGILTRKITISEGESILGKVLPNAHEDDFFMQKIESNIENQSFVSLVRKEIIQGIIQWFNNEGYFVTNLSLDCFVLSLITENNIFKGDLIDTGKQTISFENNKISAIDLNQGEGQSIQLDNEQLNPELILSFFGAFSILVGIELYDDIEDETIILRKEDFKFKQLIKVISVGALVLFLLLLSLNYMFFSSLNSRQTRLTQELETNRQIIVKLEKLQEEYKVKESLFEKSGLSAETRYSFYADRLVSVLPKGINLTQLNMDPVMKKIKEDEPIETEKNIINISGSSKTSNILNKWVRNIREFNWVEDIEIINYESEPAAQNANFEVQIVIK